MGTLSKALGSEGGFVCGSRLLVDYLRNFSRPFIFSTAPGAAAMAAASAAISALAAEPQRVGRLRENVSFFISELAKRGVCAASESAIVPVVVGDERRALAASEELERRGFLVPAIRYPTVARGSARLRFAVMSAHTRDQLSAAAEALASAVAK
jgi:7-keto-8-aminopelargonate synthetase-like enzyme